MKKILTGLLIAAMLLSLSACGLSLNINLTKKDDDADVSAPPVVSSTTDTQDNAPDNAPDDEDGEDGEDADSDDFDPAGDHYWDLLREEWRNEKEEGYVWTIDIDAVTVVDALGLAEITYDLDLSCSHVGKEMNGVYCGELAMDFSADLGGLNDLMGFMGGTASTSLADGWFRNDEFAMRLEPYNAEHEALFLATLETGETEETDPYTDALVASLLEDMGSGSEPFEENNTPVSYYFDWDYHMTEGDMSNSYSVSGVMGIASASGSIDASGTHISGGGIAHSPLGGVYTSRYSEDFFAPFPHIIRVYDTGDVVFELHSPNGGPVVIKFYGTIDKIPVSETTVAK